MALALEDRHAAQFLSVGQDRPELDVGNPPSRIQSPDGSRPGDGAVNGRLSAGGGIGVLVRGPSLAGFGAGAAAAASHSCRMRAVRGTT